MYDRVAKFLSSNSHDAKAWADMMKEYRFLPNSPTLVNAGSGKSGGLSACYVVPLEDTLPGIMRASLSQAMIHAHYGGTGFNLGRIRPRGSLIKSTGGKACGPVKVLELLNQTADTVSQGGNRNGANMGSISLQHPDAMDTIHAKDIDGRLTHFNISGVVTDEFIKAFETNDSVPLTFGEESYGERDAEEILTEVVHNAWLNGDPGLIFIDRMNKFNMTPNLGMFETTNPCGEQPLLDWESCNLGSINLGAFIQDEDFIVEDFVLTIRNAVDLLNHVIDKNTFPLPEIENATLLTRKIGLGIMGWHDYLIKLGIPWCSEEALKHIRIIGNLLMTESHEWSHQKAMEYGPFDAYEGSMWDTLSYKMMNATTTTIAPTGTLSYIAECSSGVEPVFEWKYTRTSEQGTDHIVHPTYDLAKKHGLLAETNMQIPWEWHIRHQEVWQDYVDNAVSKTINVPHDTTEQTIRDIYERSLRSNIKGLTVYRDKSKVEQVLNTVDNVPLATIPLVRRPATIYEARSGCGKMYIIVGHSPSEPPVLYDVFIESEGGCTASNEAMGRSISLGLQEGIDPSRIAGKLRKVKCHTALRSKTSDGKSCADIIGQCVSYEYALIAGRITPTDDQPRCPSCNGPLNFGSGCHGGQCPSCGWSGCA
jgi:ribonucleoside-diphosphate reductase alpha chain